MSIQLARRALLWLFAALLAVVIPHLEYLPWWLLAVLLVCMAWRFRVYQGRWSMPPAAVRWLLVLGSVVLLMLDFRRLIGLEPTTSALALACALKTIELKSRRDYLVVVFAAYFLAASQLLFSQEIADMALVLTGIIMLTAALISQHQGDDTRGFPNPLALSGKILMQSLPLMLVLFLVFPRLAPLWSIPQQSRAAKTGPSDSMSPGDFARLGNSDELAFRVSFEGDLPSRSDWYWRGLVFGQFDGRTWRPGPRSRYENYAAAGNPRAAQIQIPQVVTGVSSTRYEVILEPSQQQWAYVLGYPLVYDDTLQLGSDARLIARKPVVQRLRYTVTASTDYILEPRLREMSRGVLVQLPDGINPRAIQQATLWRMETSDDRAYAERLLDWFGSTPFVYTLQPGTYGRDSVDEFLFERRRGFCEHYASAFAVMMRAADIPTRIVAGYQGGRLNGFEKYLSVHQYDAHAWVESWIEGEGWVRFDPTAAVSPLRVESGLNDAVGDEFLADSPLALQRYTGIPIAAWLSMRWDLINYQWAKRVLQYDSERQLALLGRWLGAVTPTRMALAVVACGALLMAFVALNLFGLRRRQEVDAATRTYLRFCAALGRKGLQRQCGEGPSMFAQRASSALPAAAAAIQRITELYVTLAFRSQYPGRHPALLRELQRAVKQFDRNLRTL